MIVATFRTESANVSPTMVFTCAASAERRALTAPLQASIEKEDHDYLLATP
jgi:hypothetical protein